MLGYFPILVLAALLIMVVIGRLGLVDRTPDERVTPEMHEPGGHLPGRAPLYVVVHGLDQGKDWPQIRSALSPRGTVLTLRYRATLLAGVPLLNRLPLYANADPRKLAANVSAEIGRHFDPRRHTGVVLIGQSLGALIVRQAYLQGTHDGARWPEAVSRMVLLAGMNRGWDISKHKPADMSGGRWVAFWSGSWFGRLTGTGKLIMAAETGAPFVANLRLEWMRHFQSASAKPIEIVQLLGDIDDVVSDADNKDLRAMASANFAWLRVRGTGHADISNFSDPTAYGELKMGDYRRDKFLLAATRDFGEVKRANEEQAFNTDDDVSHIVFVVHGIRDRGEWAAAFEQALQARFKELAGAHEKLVVASIRYGYFGMGPFLFQPGRDKYVKWFMDEYTETLARYPKARHVHFVGHSNGTYLLAAALRDYGSLQVDRVALGGSVVRKQYDWPAVFKNRQVSRVLNYVAADDWVVSLFPRFFEPRWIYALLDNDIGSAGFNGFDHQPPGFTEVRYILGGHDAMLGRIPEITDFLLSPNPDASAYPRDTDRPRARYENASTWADWLLIWPALLAVVAFVGWHVVVSASEPRWPWLALYLGLVLTILFKL
ncbi:hypothetical protein [Thauera sp. 2A1]|uniref:hypothetical protein n=1 Tax=Thauera sp. 2A1 TaxID=2570191 RepID=UPI001292B3B2|nr:hypothetical protein [Thauera sp. 2A1]KAI5913699.1 hypothetical protein GH664_16705 [Thauera sp. 2A1]